jgi:hypothetical protein
VVALARQLNRYAQFPVMKVACKLAVVFLLVLATHFSHASAQNKSKITVAIPGADKYSRTEMRVHRFLWSNWQRRQTATAEVTFFGIDAGNIYTVEMKRDSNGRWVVGNTCATTKLQRPDLNRQLWSPRVSVFAGCGCEAVPLSCGLLPQAAKRYRYLNISINCLRLRRTNRSTGATGRAFLMKLY